MGPLSSSLFSVQLYTRVPYESKIHQCNLPFAQWNDKARVTSMSLLFHVSADSEMVLNIETSSRTLLAVILHRQGLHHFTCLCRDHVHSRRMF